MSNDTARSPGRAIGDAIGNAWNSLLTVYYANSVSWRVLKAGALIFFGFFLWAGSNILLSVQPAWTVLHYPMAYGFLLLVYGPVHHLVVIPLALRWRRAGSDRKRTIGSHLPNGGLAAFVALVVVLGTMPGLAAPMTIDFGGAVEGTAADIDPDVHCVKHVGSEETEIHCHVSAASGVDRVVVKSGGKVIASDDDPPYEFNVRTGRMAETMGQKRFRIVLLDENGDLVRRYTRRVSMVEKAGGE